MPALPFILAAIAMLAIAYRYYHGFIAAKVLALDDRRITPAHTMNDGHNYHPTNKWVLFGHHFAAITGAGPLIGPVLAAQFGFLPGFLWILFGVIIGGSVHDFIIFTASVRRKGKSLAELARAEISPLTGALASIAILFVVVIALAGLGLAVVNALAESAWGTFTIACTIPIAFFMGMYMYRWRVGRIREATIAGVLLLSGAVIFGKYIQGTAFGASLTLDHHSITIAIAAYGFIASVLPVWMLLCPRDYLSSFMKIGTIAFLAIGVIIVNPTLHMPMLSEYLHGGGPIFKGSVFPFVFITIACGAISGFHALVSSGTSPKMVSKETDIRLIAPGAMLIEGFIGILALTAACALWPQDYFAINATPAVFEKLGMETVNLVALTKMVGENLIGRTGGAVSLAVGMAQIFTAIPGMGHLMDYWYHFAIMFEALFILTTIDTGTRVARFLFQEVFGKVYKPFERTDWLPGTIISSALVVFLWGYFIWTGSISTIWPMFGVANQLLACIALCVGTSYILRTSKPRYAIITIVPMTFVTITTLTAGYKSITEIFLPMLGAGDDFKAYLNSSLTAIMMMCVVAILIDSIPRWMRARTKSVLVVE